MICSEKLFYIQFVFCLAIKSIKEFDQCKIQQTTLRFSCIPSVSQCLYLNSIISAWPTFVPLLKADQTHGCSTIPRGPENMFASLLLCVFGVIAFEAKNTDVSPAVCWPNPQLLLLASALCVRDTQLPSVPSWEHTSTNNYAFLPLYLHTGPQTSKQNPTSKANRVLFAFIFQYLWPSAR